MNTRRDYQVACPACRALAGRPCAGKQGERLTGVHFQRSAALRAAAITAYIALYAPANAAVTAALHEEWDRYDSEPISREAI